MKRMTMAMFLVLCLPMMQNMYGEGGRVMAEERFERGYEQLKKLNPTGAEQVIKGLSDIAPDMGQFLVAFAYGDIYARPALDAKSRQMATLAILTALGNAQPQLKWHIHASLNIGISPQEIVDAIYVQTVYSGFPAGLNAIFAAQDVFRERRMHFKPVKWDDGKMDRAKRGLRTLEETSKGAGRKVVESMSGIAPDMADFLIDFSYGTVFCRNILTPRIKEIIAMAGMTAAGNMKPQLQVHIRAALNVGLTKEQIIEVMYHTLVYAGFPAALNGIAAAGEVFAEKN